jgi:hypothetical protein
MANQQVGDLTAAILLYELDAAEAMPRSFFGERVLVQLLHLSDGWYGKTAGISRFCPRSLPIGTEVVGPKVNGHYVISVRLDGDSKVQVRAEGMGKGGSFALMFCPREDPGALQSANPFCPNPLCVNVCSLTYSQVDRSLKEMAVNSRAPAGSQPKIHWQCNVCGGTMLVDRQTFQSLYKT